MKVKIKTEAKNYTFPEVILYLDQIPSQYLFYSEYSLRHPFDILNHSLGKIFGTYKRLLNSLTSFHKNAHQLNYRIPDEVLQATSDLLLNFNSLYDDCFWVLKSICKPDNIQYKTLSEWVINAKVKSAVEFRSDTVLHSCHWKDQINLIKHGNTRLRYIVGRYSDIVVPGYYIEGVDADGSIGPIESVHPKFLGKTTAFSYNYQLRHNIMLLFDILEKLLKHLRRHFKSSYNHKLIKNREIELNANDINIVLSNIIHLPKIFFPDEVEKNTTDIYVTDKELNISYPGKLRSLGYPSMQFTFMFQVEKFHRSFHMPYLDDSKYQQSNQTVV
ncbi:hypothetical protein [Leptospira alstonii]|uniref:Uncharacterized protein n=2 Tax=Leptospira alstonii TaxID=28452 RepID=M6CFQ6_9LEPT|nr:hypothetical protein [Leptospira alstonii]EMJ90574.1 hypothetical protein LEP1GSC194_3866 [Leptospira alstonii serovar Sichuan str. 79601]EQA82022.1 hypothetical protein LEP1GSC193_3461 [Leptospira alstonii serovar Pingchang str. 80-412]